jgi:hypothetical protein
LNIRLIYSAQLSLQKFIKRYRFKHIPQTSKHGEVVMPGDIDLSPRPETSRIQSGNNNYKNRNTQKAQGTASFFIWVTSEIVNEAILSQKGRENG